MSFSFATLAKVQIRLVPSLRAVLSSIFGIGRGEFQHYTKSRVAHNAFVQNMGETGLLGLFFWVGMIYFALKCLSAVSKAEGLPPHLVSMGRGVSVSLIGYIAAASFITADESELLYILMALAAATWVIARRQAGAPVSFRLTRLDVRNIACIEIAGIACMYLVTLTLSGIV